MKLRGTRLLGEWRIPAEELGMDPAAKPYYTARETAELLGCNRETVYRNLTEITPQELAAGRANARQAD
jgi:hypothetical protein